MRMYDDNLTGDRGLGADEILRETEQDQSAWSGRDFPSTLTLRHMVLLADWASREPVRWHVYRLRYFHDLDIREIALILRIGERTVYRYLKPVHLKNLLPLVKE